MKIHNIKGNYDVLSRKGGVISVEIKWNCNLDIDFYKFCLPKYHFLILDDSGWNFRHGKYHEENKRTLVKSYGLKFVLNVNGRVGKLDLTKTIIILVTGLGLMGLANILCDVVLLMGYFDAIVCGQDLIKDVRRKKYEEINPKIDDKVLADNLLKLLQKQDISYNAVTTSMAISSIPSSSNKRKSEGSSKELQCDVYIRKCDEK